MQTDARVTDKTLLMIGLVSRKPGTNRGGSAISIARLANHFVRHGIAVHLLRLPETPGEPLPEPLADAVTVHPFTYQRRGTMVAELWRLTRQIRPAAMLAFDTRAGVLATTAARLPGAGVPAWFTPRNSLSGQMAGWSEVRIAKRRRLLNRAYRHSAGVIAISAGQAADFRDIAGVPAEENRIHVIHNSVITPHTRKLAAAPLDDPWLPRQPGSPPVILSAGRLAPQKDYPTLLEAFAILRRQRPARLLILGEGPDRAALETQARALGITADLRLPGFVSNPFAYMTHADLFALSSRWEGFGNVLAEALALGAPVVATDCPSGPAEILDGGRYGPLVPPGDAPALAAAMARTLEDPLPRETLRAAGSRYDIDILGQRYLQVMGLLGRD